MPAMYHEGSWLGNATDPEVLVKDTVGWTGKNDLPFKLSRIKELNTNGTWNGNVFSRVGATFTFSVNAEGYVTKVDVDSNGVATTGNNYITCLDFKDYQFAEGSYILSDVNGNANCYTYINRRLNDSGSVSYAIGTQNGDKSVDVDYTVYNQFQCGIGAPTGNVYNHVKLYPMLRKADITDPTYEPYHESVEVMYEEEIHGVNLLKNEATSQTINGVTFTVNADGSVTVNGTCTANYAYNVCTAANNTEGQKLRGRYIISTNVLLPNGGDFSLQKNNLSSYWDMGSSRKEMEVEFTDSEYWSGRVHIYSTAGTVWNNIRVYPMIRKADIDDPTYRPYNYQAIQNQINDKSVLGAKNLLKNTATTQTINGVTFTVNDDKSITVNGTATANADFPIKSKTEAFAPPAGEYIISRGGSPTSDVQLYVNLHNGTLLVRQITNLLNVEKFRFTLNYNGYDRIAVGVYVSSGKTINNFVINPMLRLASDPDDTYQPYAMTNRELTEKVFDKGRLTSADDLDDIKETGIYGISTSPANAPESISYCTLMVKANSAADIKQIIFNSTGASGAIYIRTYGGSPLSWKSWYKFTGTVVS